MRSDGYRTRAVAVAATGAILSLTTVAPRAYAADADRFTQAHAALQRIRDDQVANLRRLIELYDGRPLGRAWLALAHLHLQTADGVRQLSASTGEDLRADDVREAQQLAVQALRNADKLPLGAIEGQQVTALLARTLEDLGEDADAVAALRQLLRRAPESTAGREAALRLGRRALRLGQLPEAAALLAVAMGPTPPPSAPDALALAAQLQLGICMYLAADHDGAVRLLEALIASSTTEGQATSGGAGRMDRATAFYVEALARMGPWKATQKRVRTRWPAARAWAILAGAAEAYRRNGGDRSASQGLRVLGSTAAPPGLRLGARWRSVDLAHRRGRPGSLDDLDAALQATGGAAAEVRGTRWANTRVGDLGEATSRRILLALHRRVIAGEAPAEPLAHSAGQHHLVFGDQPDAWRVDLVLGDALYRLGRDPAAAQAFERVLAAEAAGPRAQEAGAGRVFALTRALAAPGADGATAAAAALAAADAYLDRWAAGPHAAAVRLDRGAALEALGRGGEARATYRQVAAGGGDAAADGAHALLVSLRRAGRWDALQQAIASLTASGVLDEEGASEAGCEAGYELALAAGGQRKAAGQLLKFATGRPGCAQAGGALLDAARRFRAARSLASARSAARAAVAWQVEAGGKSRDAWAELATICQEMADLSCAGEAEAHVAGRKGCDDSRGRSVLRAGLLLRAVGRHDEAAGLVAAWGRQCEGAEAASTLTGWAEGGDREATPYLDALRRLSGKGKKAKREEPLGARLLRQAARLADGEADDLDLGFVIAEYRDIAAPSLAQERAVWIAIGAAAAKGRRGVARAAVAAEGAGEDAAVADLLGAVDSLLAWGRFAGGATAARQLRAAALDHVGRGLLEAASALEVALSRNPALGQDIVAVAAKLRREAAKACDRAIEGLDGPHRARLTRRLVDAPPSVSRAWRAVVP